MNLALIGSWGHFGQVLHETDAAGGFPIVALAKALPDDDPAKAVRRYPSASAAQIFDDPGRMLAEIKPDVAVVSTRLDLIPHLAMAAAAAGTHLVCEKPLALDTPRLEQLWETVTTHGVQCLAMLNNRSDPILAAARNAVAEGRIGEVKLLNARKSYRLGTRPEWFADRERYGGTIPWVGIHAFDFLDAVTASPPVAVAADHANTCHPEYPGCEDVATALVRLRNGALATISVDYLRPESAATHGDDWLRIVGTEGVVEAAMGRAEARILNNEAPEEALVPVSAQPYYVPLLRSLPAPGTAGPTEATRRAFRLTHTALCARNAADSNTLADIPQKPWS